jgi:hypothetical protein
MTTLTDGPVCKGVVSGRSLGLRFGMDISLTTQ